MICGEVLPEPIAKISHRMVTERRKQISGITIKHILHYELIIDYLLIGAFRWTKILGIEYQISKLY